MRAFGELPRVTFPKFRGRPFYAFFAVDGVTDSYAFAEQVLHRVRRRIGAGRGLWSPRRRLSAPVFRRRCKLCSSGRWIRCGPLLV